MAGLLDIAPAAKRVLIPIDGGEHPVDVRGLSLLDIRDLIARFPDVSALLSAGITPDTLFRAGPEIVASIIAAACGDGGNTAAEKVASEFGIGVQAEILNAVIALTMPRGPRPFMDLLKTAGLDLGASLSAAASPAPASTSLPADTGSPTS